MSAFTHKRLIINDSTMLIQRISSEYEHTCVCSPITERSTCSICITNEEMRLNGMTARGRKHRELCECDLQESRTVYECSICTEVKREIVYIQSEIVRACAQHGYEVSQTFIVNPTFKTTIEHLAFRCRMLNEFLLRQQIKMEHSAEMVDVTDEISVLTEEDQYAETIVSQEDEEEQEEEQEEEDSYAKYNYSITIHENSSQLSLGSNDDKMTIDELDMDDSVYLSPRDAPMTLDELEVDDSVYLSQRDAPMTLDELEVDDTVYSSQRDAPMTLDELEIYDNHSLYSSPSDYPMSIDEEECLYYLSQTDNKHINVYDIAMSDNYNNDYVDMIRSFSRLQLLDNFDNFDNYEIDVE